MTVLCRFSDVSPRAFCSIVPKVSFLSAAVRERTRYFAFRRKTENDGYAEKSTQQPDGPRKL